MDVGCALLDVGVCCWCCGAGRLVLVGMGLCASVFGMAGLEDLHGCERGNGRLDGRSRARR